MLFFAKKSPTPAIFQKKVLATLMANRLELSHYILDFAMKTRKKVKEKDIEPDNLKADLLVSDLCLICDSAV